MNRDKVAVVSMKLKGRTMNGKRKYVVVLKAFPGEDETERLPYTFSGIVEEE